MFKKFYDISITLVNNGLCYPGDIPFMKYMTVTQADGCCCNASVMNMSAHSGTHIDAPMHFFTGRKTIDKIDLPQLILPAEVIEIANPEKITAEELKKHRIPLNSAVLFKTKNSTNNLSESRVYNENYVSLTGEAASYCLEKKARLVGIDGISADLSWNTDFPVHKILLGNDIVILENINLKEVPPGSYTLICLPLKIEGGDGSPVRAVLAK